MKDKMPPKRMPPKGMPPKKKDMLMEGEHKTASSGHMMADKDMMMGGGPMMGGHPTTEKPKSKRAKKPRY